MARRAPARGFTLIEAMVAMAVLLIGTLGLISLHTVGVRMNADARVMTQATDIAQDLVSQMQGWPYATDPRLVNANTSNDADFADTAFAFQSLDVLTAANYDHEEGELEPNGWNGIPTATVQALGFTRYWNIAEMDYDQNGVLQGKRVAVIVRWGEVGRWRRIVLVTYLQNPQIAF